MGSLRPTGVGGLPPGEFHPDTPQTLTERRGELSGDFENVSVRSLGSGILNGSTIFLVATNSITAGATPFGYLRTTRPRHSLDARTKETLERIYRNNSYQIILNAVSQHCLLEIINYNCVFFVFANSSQRNRNILFEPFESVVPI